MKPGKSIKKMYVLKPNLTLVGKGAILKGICSSCISILFNKIYSNQIKKIEMGDVYECNSQNKSENRKSEAPSPEKGQNMEQ